MNSHEYQTAVQRTLTITDRDQQLLMCGLGLPGEAGEVADHIKKYWFQGHKLDPAELKEELGDVAWYLAVACTALGFTLSDIFEANQAKLRKRYPTGFSAQASLDRIDKVGRA